MEFLSRAKERFVAGLGTRRPWKEMVNFRAIGLPSSFSDAIKRVRTNISYFLMNYAIVVLVILFLSLLWHPISLIVYIAMMAAWLFLYFLRDEPLQIFHRVISDHVVMIVLSVLTVVVLLFTGATVNVLVSILVGVVLVLVHASIMKIDDLDLDEEAAEHSGLLTSKVSGLTSKILPS